VRTIIESAVGDCDFISDSTVEQLSASWRSRQYHNTIIFADCPELSIVDAILKSRSPIVLFTERPEDIVSFAIAERQFDHIHAIRLATQCLAVLNDMFYRDQILFVGRSQRKLSDLIQAIAHHYSLPVDVKTILTKVGSSGDETVEADIQRRLPHGKWFNIDPDTSPEHGFLKTAVAPFSAPYFQRRIDSVYWPAGLFLKADSGGAYCDGRMPLVGRARHLFHGPYMHLPRGPWTAKAELLIGENFSGNGIIADIWVGHAIAIGHAKLPIQGHFTFELPFVVEDPRSPIELRIAITEGAIEGWLELRGVSLSSTAYPKGVT
jgi:hypothetical protein